MRFLATQLEGVFEITSDIRKDDRGSFLRAFDLEQLQEILDGQSVFQVNVSTTTRKGTIRGMHMQKEPFSEFKIVRCLKGSAFDVAVDMRPNSKSFLEWTAINLSSQENNAIFIPMGFAHGFQTLEDDTALLYIHSSGYSPESEVGFSYDDPSLGIDWPLEPRNMSEKDRAYPWIGVGIE